MSEALAVLKDIFEEGMQDGLRDSQGKGLLKVTHLRSGRQVLKADVGLRDNWNLNQALADLNFQIRNYEVGQ